MMFVKRPAMEQIMRGQRRATGKNALARWIDCRDSMLRASDQRAAGEPSDYGQSN
jgi:hypothetical protein